MDFDEFARLKTPHLVAFSFSVLIVGLTVAYGIFAFTHRLNNTSECNCGISEKSNGTSIDQKDQPSLRKGRDFFWSDPGAF